MSQRRPSSSIRSVLLGSTKRISMRPLANETSLKTALRATCCFSGTVYRYSAETRSGSCWQTKQPPNPARTYLSRKPLITSLSVGMSRSNPGGLLGLNSSRRTTLMSCPSTNSWTVPIARAQELQIVRNSLIVNLQEGRIRPAPCGLQCCPGVKRRPEVMLPGYPVCRKISALELRSL